MNSDTFYTDTQQHKVSRIIPDLIRSREILWDLVTKGLRVRYRFAALGFLWAVLQPLLMTLILTFVFVYVFEMRFGDAGDGIPYAIAPFLLCALVPWQFFAASLSGSTKSLLDNANIIKKIYFPREVIPLAAVLDRMVNLLIGFVLLLIIHKCFGGTFGMSIIWLPVIFAIQFVIIIGMSLILSSAYVFFRDVEQLVEVVLMFGFYATPIFYELSMVRGRLALHPWLYKLYLANPMAGLITAYRQALLDGNTPDLALLAWPAAFAVISLVCGALLFRRNASKYADLM